ncbi:MAG: type II and III secretion system protein family protein [Sphingopyxis sp.]|jgi:pilus assembly protein CpaC|nr:type II and III secretion system protein family protein [Sphingopyxis sp.]
MTSKLTLRDHLLAGVMMAGLALSGITATPVAAQSGQGQRSQSNDVVLSVGRGRVVNLPTSMTDVFVANDTVADVQVRSSTQIFVFGKAPGETSISATDASGRVIYSVVVRVGNNIETIDQMLTLAMPDADITVNTMNGIVLLTGTVRSPEDAAEADRLVTAFVGEGTRVLSRLQTATPLQVNLQVRIAEVNRTLVREIGGNLLSRDNDRNGIIFGAFRGRTPGTITDQTLPTRIFPNTPGVPNDVPVPYDPETGRPLLGVPPQIYTINPLQGASTLALGGRLFGLDLLGALDMGERTGMVATLAQPNLTTISGETADFLAGGEFPVPIPDPGSNQITIEYKRFGVSLAYTPTVLSDGRISLRVRPEVSELSSEGSIRINGFEIPALTVRRAETTVELGSGESFMIAGLMNNRSVGAVDSTPGLGDMPILGNLFRSDNFRRGDTELVIVVTPYLVRPVNADQIVLPTDGFRNATPLQRMGLNAIADGQSGATRPMPQLEAAPTAPGMGSAPVASATPPAREDRDRRRGSNRDTTASVAPGFSYNQ